MLLVHVDRNIRPPHFDFALAFQATVSSAADQELIGKLDEELSVVRHRKSLHVGRPDSVDNPIWPIENFAYFIIRPARQAMATQRRGPELVSALDQTLIGGRIFLPGGAITLGGNTGTNAMQLYRPTMRCE